MGGGETVVTLLGDRMVHIENYRGILQYSDSYIRILARQGQICISGKNFCICYYDRDEMKLTGRFDSLRLESGGRRGDA